jgi:hypothetical protein
MPGWNLEEGANARFLARCRRLIMAEKRAGTISSSSDERKKSNSCASVGALGADRVRVLEREARVPFSNAAPARPFALETCADRRSRTNYRKFVSPRRDHRLQFVSAEAKPWLRHRFIVAAGALAATCGFARASAAQENLHVAVACGEYPVMYPERGLHVSVDGVTLQGRIVYASSLYETPHGHLGVTTAIGDIVFFAPPGAHMLHVDADNCAAIDRRVEIGSRTNVTGRLEIDNPILRGPSGTPDGFDFAMGAFVSTLPSLVRSGTGNQGSYTPMFTTTSASMPGFTVSRGNIHRFFTFLAEESLGFGTQNGVAHDGGYSGQFWRHISYSDTSLRVGARLPLHNFALSAGSGVALTIWSPGASNGYNLPDPLGAPEFTVNVPVWAMLDVKPTCNWGLRFTGTLSLNPVVTGETSFMTSAMIFYQPTTSCSESSGVQIGSW